MGWDIDRLSTTFVNGVMGLGLCLFFLSAFVNLLKCVMGGGGGGGGRVVRGCLEGGRRVLEGYLEGSRRV